MSFGELQNALFAQVVRDFSNFRKTGETRRTSNYLSTRLSILDDNLATARRYHEEIMGAGKLEKDLTKEELMKVYEQLLETHLDYRCELLDAIDKCASTAKAPTETINTSSAAAGTSGDLRLPKINIPTFSGCYTKWRSFYDIFTSLIHTNTHLSDIQKLHHLKSSISGDAERLIQHLGLEAENYVKAWDLLKARYDHKRVLVNAQLNLFFSQPSLTKESTNGLRSMLDTSQECFHALENLGVPVNHWDVILIYILFQKLPCSTQHLWEEKLGNSTELPSRKDFIGFLEARFRTLEAVDQQPLLWSKANTKSSAKSSPQAKVFYSNTQMKEQFQCKVCHHGKHALRKCSKFLRLDTTHKWQTVRRVKVCENCLAYSHPTRDCPSSKNCYFCQQRHHSLLHLKQNFKEDQASQVCSQVLTETSNPTGTTSNQTQLNSGASEFVCRPIDQPHTSHSRNTFFATQHRASQVLLATAIVTVVSADGRCHDLRALVDPGSEATFITESAAQLLRLPRRRASVQISGLGRVSSGTSKYYVDITLRSKYSTFESATKAFIFQSLTGLLPAQRVMVDELNHIKGLLLADPAFFNPAKIDILLGSEVYSDIILPDIIRSDQNNSIVAQKTQFGWIVFGKIPDRSTQLLQSFSLQLDLGTEIRRFWEVEEAPFKMMVSEEDNACEQHFRTHTTRLTNGRYQVSLPFKDGVRPALGSSREVALRRFTQLERRFQKDPKLKVGYKRCMLEYITMDHMEEVDLLNHTYLATPFHFFVPHQAVIKDSSSTTKVVFDATSKTSDCTSLNEHLMVGPKLQKSIIDVILKWRQHRDNFTADIEKMYRQIVVPTADSNYQLIFWRDSEQQPLRAYRLKTVTFGTSCIPYLAIRVLNKVADNESILRVGGRLQKALIPYHTKHPIILKPNHAFTNILIRHAYDQTYHGGLQQTMAYIRSKYWILNMKRSVKKHMYRCVICFRFKVKPMQQIMGSLPSSRVRIARPFSNTGVDYAGPVEVKTWKGRGAKTLKGYFAIFICLATKAIHLELVSDMTTQAFLAAFRRFTARRGICSRIFSDCGTNFIGANAELRRMMKDAAHDWENIAETLANLGTQWKFIPPASPHFGGLWEAGVKSVKHHLKRVVKNKKLTFEEFSTVLTQIEGILNSRPLCPLSENPEDLDVLTPGHFLIGEPTNMVPQGDLLSTTTNYLDRWKHVQIAVAHFWRKWKNEYLSRLQSRPKWAKLEADPKIGDLVLVKDERLPPAQWILARIIDTHPGMDNHIRVVTLKTANGTLKRPITKICYLPSNNANENNTII